MIYIKNPSGIQEVLNVNSVFQALAGNTYPLTIKNQNGNTIFSLYCSAGGNGEIQLKNNLGTNIAYINANGLSSFNSTTSGLVIGANSKNASALFQIDSTTLGFLPPRMTAAQKNAIGSPTAGLMVFDTDAGKLCVYNGAAWRTITDT